MESILKDFQRVIHDVNPYVKDFKQVIEQKFPEETHARIVLSDKGRPTEAHGGACNPVTNCNELSILTGKTKKAFSDLAVRRASGWWYNTASVKQ